MAKGDAIVKLNPTDGLVMPRCRRAVDKRIITIEDILRAQMVLELRERLMFRLAVFEGMRPGEITGLQIVDLHSDGMFHVERRVYWGLIDEPKSWRSRRKIPATDATRDLWKRWVELLIDQHPEAWLFPSEGGDTQLPIRMYCATASARRSHQSAWMG